MRKFTLTEEQHRDERGESIEDYRLLALRGALRLECQGLKRRGRSAYSIIKDEFGFSGSRDRVLAQLDELIIKRNQRHNDKG